MNLKGLSQQTMGERGQIQPHSQFGRMLTQLARQSETIVEIGTWRGLGSTLCLANGLVRSSQRLITVEADLAMHAEAKALYNDPRISFLYGTISPMNDVDIVLDKIPTRIDLLLLDGGDGNSKADLDLLQDRCSVVALDDTNDCCEKNRDNRKRLIKEGWTVVADRQDDRNGWAIFKRQR